MSRSAYAQQRAALRERAVSVYRRNGLLDTIPPAADPRTPTKELERLATSQPMAVAGNPAASMQALEIVCTKAPTVADPAALLDTVVGNMALTLARMTGDQWADFVLEKLFDYALVVAIKENRSYTRTMVKNLPATRAFYERILTSWQPFWGEQTPDQLAKSIAAEVADNDTLRTNATALLLFDAGILSELRAGHSVTRFEPLATLTLAQDYSLVRTA